MPRGDKKQIEWNRTKLNQKTVQAESRRTGDGRA